MKKKMSVLDLIFQDKSDATIGGFDERLIYNGTLHDCEVAPYFNFIYKQIEVIWN